MVFKNICVFCGSRPGTSPIYNEAVTELGRVLAENGIGLVYGGANVGLMGAVADAALAAGGRVIGVIPQSLVAREIAHSNLTELIMVATMHERKARMIELSDGFIALPGGFGTLDEFCEVLTWSQLGFHRKPCAILNVANYFDPLLALFDHGVREGFIRAEQRQAILVQSDVTAILEALKNDMPNFRD